MTGLKQFRSQYPQYNDMSDEELASALHRRFYGDMPVEEVFRRAGIAQQKQMNGPLAHLGRIHGPQNIALMEHMAEQNRLARAERAADPNRLRGGAYDWLTDKGLSPALSGELTGLLDYLPVAGDVSGAEDTYQYAKRKEWLPAAIAGGATALGVLPFLGDIGSGLVRSAPDVTRGAGKTARKPIRAYHGSPHDYAAERLVRMPDGSERFLVGAPDKLPDVPEGATVLRDYPLGRARIDKMGTGEGAQAFGSGWYAAEAEGTARTYRDDLTEWMVSLDNRRVPVNTSPEKIASEFNIPADDADTLQRFVRGVNADPQKGGVAAGIKAKRSYLAMIDDYAKDHPLDAAQKVRRAQVVKDLDIIEKYAPRLEDSKGRMYEVALHADPEDFLDWDKPLSEQSPAFYEMMGRRPDHYGIVTPDGKFATNMPLTKEHADEFIADFRRGYARHGGNPDDWRIVDYSKKSEMPNRPLYEGFDLRGEGAAKGMAEAGIPGIKYFDAGSRAAGEGTRNYVVFDEDIIEILRKYGWAGLTPFAAGLLMDTEPQN